MPRKQIQLANNEIYHVITRGVGDTKIFKDRNDNFRAIFSLYEFNTIDSIEIRKQRDKRRPQKGGGQTPADQRTPLVEILCFCLMPNHVHLLLRQVQENGISQFMKKVNGGFAGYFNRKYQRKGHLFQGRFKSVHIKDDKQLRVVFVYVHTNPVALIEGKFREKGIRNEKKVIQFLENYKWSSYKDYLGGQNFPSVTERNFLLDVFGGPKKCKNFVDDWIRYKKEVGDFMADKLE